MNDKVDTHDENLVLQNYGAIFLQIWWMNSTFKNRSKVKTTSFYLCFIGRVGNKYAKKNNCPFWNFRPFLYGARNLFCLEIRILQRFKIEVDQCLKHSTLRTSNFICFSRISLIELKYFSSKICEIFCKEFKAYETFHIQITLTHNLQLNSWPTWPLLFTT